MMKHHTMMVNIKMNIHKIKDILPRSNNLIIDKIITKIKKDY